MSYTLGCTTRPYATSSLAEACRHIAEAGYTDVALFGNALPPESDKGQVQTARRTVEAAGLRPSMLMGRTHLGQGAETALAAYKRQIDNAAALGAAWLLDTGVADPSLYEDYLTLMQEAAPYADALGVQITLKPHGGISLTTGDLISTCRRVGHPGFGICYDPGNIIYYTTGAERPEAHVDAVAPLVTACIIKDCIVRDGRPDVMITPGEGWVDFGRVLSALAHGGFRGPLYLECVGGTSLEEIDRNVRRTRTFIQGLQG
jgi:sugar phosphate isomerase/epimerase